MRTLIKLEILFSTIIGVLLVGTYAYHSIEGWGFLDSLYFTSVTVTTIGYGDFHPVTAFGKIFTIFFAFVGVGITLFSLSIIGSYYFDKRQEMIKKRLEKSIIHDIQEKMKKKKNDIIKGSKF